MAERIKVERSGGEDLLLVVAALGFAVVQAYVGGTVGARVWNTFVVPGLPLPLIGWRVIAGLLLLRQLIFGIKANHESDYQTTSAIIAHMLAVAVLYPLTIWFVLWAVRP